MPAQERFGILPKGRILRSPCRSFYLQLIEPEPGILDVEDDECLQRIGLGAPDVPAAKAVLVERGVEFVASKGPDADQRGAVTRGTPMFELVHHERAAARSPS